MYEETGVRDLSLSTPATYMASTTDYTNWQDTHRVTCGVGFTFDQLRLDLAYQFSARSGDFYPYMHRDSGNTGRSFSAQYIDDATGQTMELSNQCSAVKVKDNRHQLLCTLTYTF